jgi:phytoene dehydrogenase-like protein
MYDAIVIGSGPNGLAAAITIAEAGLSVLIYEAEDIIGGSARSAELTLSGFVHDTCSTVHALALCSPFLRSLPLAEHGLELLHPPAPFAHPFDDGTAVIVERSVDETAERLGDDAAAYRKLMMPFVSNGEHLLQTLLSSRVPLRRPFLMTRFGLAALRSARSLATARFKGKHARGCFAGVAAHSILPLENVASSSFGLVLGVAAHAVGWPVARGGSQSLTNALVSYLRSRGGKIITGARIKSLEELPTVPITLCDVSPRQLINLAGTRLPHGYRTRLERYRYGPGVFKIDWALDGPIPWRAKGCGLAGTIHIGGTLEEIADSERAAWNGRHHEKPYVILVQQSIVDPTRAPENKHTGWAYCHVPNGSAVDMTNQIEAQVERFAPGFRELVLARHVMGPAAMEAHNANLIGGDITGGAQDIRQFLARPVASFNPYATPLRGVYICSASTPPGGGVHGMCGHLAAKSALKEVFNIN